MKFLKTKKLSRNPSLMRAGFHYEYREISIEEARESQSLVNEGRFPQENPEWFSLLITIPQPVAIPR